MGWRQVLLFRLLLLLEAVAEYVGLDRHRMEGRVDVVPVLVEGS